MKKYKITYLFFLLMVPLFVSGCEEEGTVKYEDCRQIITLKENSLKIITKSFTCMYEKATNGKILGGVCANVDLDSSNSCIKAYVYYKNSEVKCLDENNSHVSKDGTCVCNSGLEFNKDQKKCLPSFLNEADNFKNYLDKISKLPRTNDPQLFGETSIWPVQGWVTSDIGSPSSLCTGAPKFHEGIDIAAPNGAPIYAPAEGQVSFAGSKVGYGNAIVLEHGYGIATLYGHASAIYVKKDDKIKKGQLLGAVGNTPACAEPHLHYEVHVDGVPTDPMKFVSK